VVVFTLEINFIVSSHSFSLSLSFAILLQMFQLVLSKLKLETKYALFGEIRVKPALAISKCQCIFYMIKAVTIYTNFKVVNCLSNIPEGSDLI